MPFTSELYKEDYSEEMPMVGIVYRVVVFDADGQIVSEFASAERDVAVGHITALEDQGLAAWRF